MKRSFVSLLTFLFFFIPVFAGDLWHMVEVSDGDTIWIKKEGQRKIKVRVWGIDTPEKYHSEKLERAARKCGVDVDDVRRLGVLATKHAESLFSQKGKQVEVEFKGMGYYGRYLGIIHFADGTDFGKQMITDGYACVYWRNTKQDYINAQERAKSERAGLWGVDYGLMRCLCE